MGEEMKNNNNNISYPRSFQGIWIPVELYYNRELTWLEKILLLDIQSSSFDDNEDTSSSLLNSLDFDYLCNLLNISIDILVDMISKLIELGYIAEEHNNNSFSINLNTRRLCYEE